MPRAPSRTRSSSNDSEAATRGKRSALKREAIVDAARDLFLAQGYRATSMEQVATAAGVSKQTVYKQFKDKERLFTGIVVDIVERAQGIAESLTARFETVRDPEGELPELAAAYAEAVVNPRVVQLRRLVITQAPQFPDLAQEYFEKAVEVGLQAIAAGLETLAARDLLDLDDPRQAATHFAYLVLGASLDRALFRPDDPADAGEIRRRATEGTRCFLAAYRRR
jgi:TetR/AcrR family transcriptional repressor of mexJK operon